MQINIKARYHKNLFSKSAKLYVQHDINLINDILTLPSPKILQFSLQKPIKKQIDKLLENNFNFKILPQFCILQLNCF